MYSKNLSTILGAALVAIVAFYFGSKGIQRKEKEQEKDTQHHREVK